MTTLEALADETRRRIVELLALADLPAGEIAESFDVSGPAVSRHLRVLREAEVVRYRRDGQRWVYSLDPRPLIELEGWVRHNVDTWRRRFAALEDHLDDMEAQEEPDRETKS